MKGDATQGSRTPAGTLPPVARRSLGAGASSTSPKAAASSQQGINANSSNKPCTPPLRPGALSRWPSGSGNGSSSCNSSDGLKASGRGRGSATGSFRARSAGSSAAGQGTLSVSQYETASADALQAQVQLVQDAVGACQAAFAKARADVTKCMQRKQQLEQQIG
jgi:hypothetical protein